MAIPLLGLGIIGGLVAAVGSIVGRVLLALGFGFVAYTGITAILDALKAQVIQSVQQTAGFDALLLQLLGVLKVDVALSILFSAVSVRLVIMGLQSDVIKRLVVR